MKAKLYKYIVDSNIEFNFHINSNNEHDLIILPYTFQIEEFYKLLKPYPVVFDDEGVIVHLKDGYFAIELKEILEFFGYSIDDMKELLLNDN